MMERNERLKAADKCASRYTDKNEARIARSSFMLGCEFEAQGEAIKGVNLESEKPMQEELEAAEKDTIERAIAWLKEHANEYIVDLTPTYPDAPANIIVGGMCWEHLKTFLENE